MIDVETFHRLIDTLLGTLGRIVPGVDAILSVAPHLGRKIILATRNILESLAKHRLSLVMAIIGADIDEVHAQFDSREDSFQGIGLLDAMEHTAERRSSETKLRDLHAGLSYFVVVHKFRINN